MDQEMLLAVVWGSSPFLGSSTARSEWFFREVYLLVRIHEYADWDGTQNVPPHSHRDSWWSSRLIIEVAPCAGCQ